MADEQYRIDIVADPAGIVAAARTAERALTGVEKEAADLRSELVGVMQVRDAGTNAALERIGDILEATQARAIITDARISQLGKDVSGRGLKGFNDELEDTENRALRLRSLFGGLFAGISAGLLVREFVEMSDALAGVQNRLRLVTDSSEELVQVQDQLFEVSNRTRTAFEGTATVFTRLATSREELGRSNQQLLQFTESLNQAIALSGATAQEATAGLIQLSQGLSSGALRGDELRSVLENLPAVADVIAKGLGVTRGELRLLGEQGKITATSIIESFEKARGELADKFGKTVPTIGQSLAVLRNEAVELVGGFNEATGASTLLSQTILVLADNLGAVTIVGGAFATLIGYTLAAQAIPTAIKALQSLRVAAVATAGPFVAIGAAALAATTYISGLIEEQNQAVAAANKALEEDSLFGSIGAQIRIANKELRDLEAARKRQGFLSESQAARVQELTGRIQENNVASQEAVRIAREKEAADARSAKATSALLAELEKEAQLLRLSSDEQKIQEEVLKRVEELKKSKVDLDKQGNESLRAEVEAAVRRNSVLEQQREIVERIRGPQIEYQRQLELLRGLLDDNRISQDEYNRAVQEFRPPAQQPNRDTASGRLELLKRENEELAIKAQHMDLTEQGLLIELELKRQGVTLTTDEQNELGALLLKRYELNKVLDEEKKKRQEAAQAAQAAERAEEAQQKRVDALRARLDLNAQLIQQEKDLLLLREQEPALIEEVDAALQDLRIRQLENAQGLEAGFERAFLKIKREAEDLAAVGEDVVNVFADRATDALIEFARTGQFAFKEFASAILEDLTRIIARLLIVQAISAALGLASPASPTVNTAANTALNSGRQFGGTVQPGQRPFPVGENGPELFVPNQTGTIVPNERDRPQAAPQVNLQVVNVDDPRLVPQAISAGLADEAILNVLNRNRDAFRQMVS